MSTRPRRVARGFTLIEVVMVMVIIGLIAAAALPRINLTGYRVNAAVRGLNGLMARARGAAVTSQANVNVVFDVANNSVRVHEDANNNNSVDTGERVNAYPLGETVVFGRGAAPIRVYGDPVSFTRRQNGLPVLIFRRDGSASENGAIYVTSLNAAAAGRSQDTRSLEVVRALGRTELFQYSGTQWDRKF